ncbi:MAG TPA: tetratricopeptide repeat protein, partial [Conexibacter sp.]|nr:tetratricopeptide repeat protein [Conexibacter sp.]
LLAGLRGMTELPDGGDDDGGRTTSLAASVAYSFEHLDPETRRLLVAICLFHGVADADVLGAMSAVIGVPERFAGFDTEQWTAALDTAAGVGLLTRLGAGMYAIHPALPRLLALLWRSEEGAGYEQQRTAATHALLIGCAVLGQWLSTQFEGGDAALALRVVEFEQRTFGNLIGFAIEHERWAEVQAIFQPLGRFYEARALDEESRAWIDRLRHVLEDADGAAPPLDTPAGQLWLLLAGMQAGNETERHQLDSAEAAYRELLAKLEAQPRSDDRERHLATTYHQLGVVAALRSRLDLAERWHRRALAISEQRGDRAAIAAAYQDLGITALKQREFDAADAWLRKALALGEEIHDQPSIANTCHHLGILAEMRRDLAAAKAWYVRSLAISEALGDRKGMSSAYHQLGVLAYDSRDLDEAEAWFTKALVIKERSADVGGMASSYHQLGMVAERRSRLEEAERWYTKALAMQQQLGNKVGVSMGYGQLGLLVERRGDPAAGLEWVIRSVTVFDTFPHPDSFPGPPHLARLTHALGLDALATSWRSVTGAELPEEVRSYVEAQNAQTREDETR